MSAHHLFFLILLLVPLSIDTFVISTALGLAGLPKKDQNRTSLILASFEAGMPIIGVLIGHSIGGALGNYANYIAAAVIGLAGLLMLRPDKNEDSEEAQMKLIARSKGFAIISLGLSISLDSLAIGLSLGLLHVSLLFVVVFVGIESFLASRLGLWIGDKLSNNMREHAEKLSGILLVLIALALAIAKASGHPL
jgi:putative Mn2+ efflux pump MntP